MKKVFASCKNDRSAFKFFKKYKRLAEAPGKPVSRYCGKIVHLTKIVIEQMTIWQKEQDYSFPSHFVYNCDKVTVKSIDYKNYHSEQCHLLVPTYYMFGYNTQSLSNEQISL